VNRRARVTLYGIAALSLVAAPVASAQFARPNPCSLLSPADIQAVTGQTMADPQLSSDMKTCRVASFQAVPYSVIDTGASVTVSIDPSATYDADYFSTAGATRQPFVGIGQGAIAVTDSVPRLRVKQRSWVYTITYQTGSAAATGVPAIVDAERRLALRLMTRAP
jgi:hypothetical protein